MTNSYHKNWLLRQQKASFILHFEFCILKLTAKLQFEIQFSNRTTGHKKSTHREVSAAMRHGCEAQNPISFFYSSRLRVFPQGKREHRRGADEQDGGIDDLAGLIGCAAHAEQSVYSLLYHIYTHMSIDRCKYIQNERTWVLSASQAYKKPPPAAWRYRETGAAPPKRRRKNGARIGGNKRIRRCRCPRSPRGRSR